MPEPNPDGAGELLERSRELSELERQLEAIGPRANGHVVVVSGEAGIGKTTLLRAFRGGHASGPRFLWGACDPLFTPRPLGPINDVAEQAGGELDDLVTRGSKPFESASLLRELGQAVRSGHRDLLWVDEASLDVLRLLVRRVETVPALVVASYRDDDLSPGSPVPDGARGTGATPVRHPVRTRTALRVDRSDARRAARRGSARALPSHYGQPVLRDGVPCRRRRADSADRPRLGPRPCSSLSPRARAAKRSRSGPRRPSPRCCGPWPRTSSRPSTSA